MKGMWRLALAFSVLLVGIGCENAATKAARAAEGKKIEIETQAKEKAQAEALVVKKQAEEQQAKAAAEAKKKQFDSLKKNFTQEKDKFDNQVTWRHRTYSRFFNQNGRGIVAEIIEGRIKCYSVYVADSWLFHTAFFVKIGAEQKHYSGHAQHEVLSGIAECVNLSGADSTELCRFIAESNPKTPIEIRLDGKWYKDINLSASHRKAITETWAFYQAMR